MYCLLQVSIGTLVAGGPADLDGRLRRNDEILYIDGISVVGATHRRVISLMGNAALAGEVSLGVRRRPNRSGSTYSIILLNPFNPKLIMQILSTIQEENDGVM